jgi:hypothetical protein
MPWKDWSTLLIRKGSRQEGPGGIGGIERPMESLGKPRKI